MIKNKLSMVFIGMGFLGSLAVFGDPVSREVCNTGVVSELNQSLQEEATDLKDFLDTRKRATLSERDKVEVCSRWSAMNSYARSMAKHYKSASSEDGTARMVRNLKSDLESNNNCWVNPSPVLADMLQGVRIVISRAARIEEALFPGEK